MNKHLQKMKEEEEAFRKSQKRGNKRTFVAILICFFATMLAVQFNVINFGRVDAKDDVSSVEPPAEQEIIEKEPPPAGEIPADDDGKWQLILVNAQNTLPLDFTVSLMKISGGKVDYRIEPQLTRMIAAARAEGINLSVCSAYRDVKKQKLLHASKVQYYKSQGYSDAESAKQAGRFVQPATASEHHTGLAVDFLTGTGSTLSQSFGNTKSYKWLSENAATYGFVERYGKDKEEITGVAWEPWHYRYVGVENATAMKNSGLCLEEYVATVQKTQ